MIDNEIIKALECCNVETDCKRCPLYKERSANCIDIACKNALDLITRQQTEIENLKVENQSLRGAANSLKMHYEEAQSEIERLKEQIVEVSKTIKSEAVKEFAERLKEKSCSIVLYGDIVPVSIIDRIVKEMVCD